MESPGRFAVIVTFDLAPGGLTEFLELVTENARTSIAFEPECLQFDVLVPTGTEEAVVLYEVYTTEAAFEHHLSLPHFASFDATSHDLVRNKRVIRLQRSTNMEPRSAR